jgi:tetratricopeptide (TPR) repeat protein
MLSGFSIYGATVNSEYKMALDYFNSGNTDLAIKIWDNLLTARNSELSNVQKVSLRLRLDFALDKKKREEENAAPSNTMELAIVEFNRACRMAESEANKADAPSQFERVLELLKKCYNEGLITNEQSYYEAYCLIALDRLDEVPSLLDTSIENQPNVPAPLNLLAVYLDKTGNLDQKIIALKKSLAIEPNQPEIEYILVSSLIATKSRQNLKEAAIVSMKAVRGNEEKARALAELFPKSEYKEKLETLAIEIAIKNERTKMKETMAAKGQMYSGPKLKVIAGSETPTTPGAGGETSQGDSNGNGAGNASPAGGTPPPPVPPN